MWHDYCTSEAPDTLQQHSQFTLPHCPANLAEVYKSRPQVVLARLFCPAREGHHLIV